MFYREFVDIAVSKLTLNAVSIFCECGQIYVFIFYHARGFLFYFIVINVKPVKCLLNITMLLRERCYRFVFLCVCVHENVVNLKTIEGADYVKSS
jgi:hypothetical protein